MHDGSNTEPNKRGYTEGLPRCVQREGCLPGLYDIELDDSVPPIQNRPCRIPHMMRTAVQEKLQAVERDGWIAKVDTPTEWISNLTAVWKSDKVQVKVCLDPQDLNNKEKPLQHAYLGRCATHAE